MRNLRTLNSALEQDTKSGLIEMAVACERFCDVAFLHERKGNAIG